MPSRRIVLSGALAGLISPARAQVSRPGALAFAFEGIDGRPIRLAEHAGRVLLVANTASSCGFTNQYADLQTLHERYGARGLTVIGVPSDDFNQERGSNAEIAQFCQSRFGVTFLMAGKHRVTGADAHSFFRWVASERPTDIPTWNFHKYVIGRSGRLVGAFASRVRPSDPRIVALIETQLNLG